MKKIIVELLNSLYDLKLFLKYSFKPEKLSSKNNYEAFLTKQYHIIEKGLALPKPRFGFGEKKIVELIDKTRDYTKKYGKTYLYYNIVSVLNQYVDFHKKNQQQNVVVEIVEKFLFEENQILEHITGGVKKNTFSNIDQSFFLDFMQSRTSVRNFIDKEVSKEIITKAIDAAKFTPSVCNRQGWKIHSYTGSLKDSLLKLQNGNSGFSSVIKNLIIITGDISYFSYNERNQVGIDSGMFSMSFILALHSLGISSCSLNACVSLKVEDKIKNIASIPNNEKVIMFLALGYATENCNVAKSLRRDSESFIVFH